MRTKAALVLFAACSTTCSRFDRSLDAADQSRSVNLTASETLAWAEGHVAEAFGRYGVGGHFMLLVPKERAVLHTVVAVPGLDAGFVVVALNWAPVGLDSVRLEMRSLNHDGGTARLGSWIVRREEDGGLIEAYGTAHID